MSDGPKQRPSSAFHLLAGTASGFTSSILLQPFDLLKTRVQQESSVNAGNYGRSSASGLAKPAQSFPIFRALKTILAEPQPIKQLWRGTIPSVIRTSFGSGLYFASLERMRRTLAQLEVTRWAEGANVDSAAALQASQRTSALPKLGVTANLATGALARASVGFIMMPITVLKVRFESNMYTSAPTSLSAIARGGSAGSSNPYASLWSATKNIAAKEGWRGFFKGAGATAVRDAPYAGVYLGFYETTKGAMSSAVLSGNTEGGVSGSTSAMINFSAGAFAAALATTVTNPPDVVKTRLQLMPDKYTNAVQAVKLMIKEEGLSSMWGGLGLRIGRKALSSALAWTVYEEAVRRAANVWKTE